VVEERRIQEGRKKETEYRRGEYRRQERSKRRDKRVIGRERRWRRLRGFRI